MPLERPKISTITDTSGTTYDLSAKYDSDGNVISDTYATKEEIPEKGLVILSYGNSTWAEFLEAYQSNNVVYCRASSNSNPATGSQTRLAFMAYVSDATNPTNVEFQYYRSVSTHSDSQQGDQVYVYKLTNAGAWTVTVRSTFTKVAAGKGLSGTLSSGTYTTKADLVSETNLTNAAVAATEVAGRVYPVAPDANGKLAVNVPWESGSGGADPSSTTPSMDGTASVGTENAYARGDHVHPSDTSKENVSNKTTEVTYLSTDTQYPSAKAVYDMVKLGRVLHNGYINYGAVIVQNSIIGMSYGITNSRYITITPGTSVDLSYPLLYWTGESYDSGTKGVTGNTDSFYAIENVRIQNNQSCTVGGMIYMVGTLSGNIFTADATTMFTNTPPSTEDGKVYIPIGIAKSNSSTGCTLDFKPYGQIFEYRNGAFRPLVSGLDVFNAEISELDEKILGMISDTVWSLSDMQDTPRALSDGEIIVGEVSSGEWALIQITDDLIAGYDLIAQPMWEAVTVSGSLYYIINQLALKENLSNKVTSLSASSTDTQYPSAKTVYDAVKNTVSGSGTSGYLAKFNATRGVTNGPQLGSSTTTYLRNDGSWATPPGTPVLRYNTTNQTLYVTTS